jgi:hypothetical protein
MSPDKGDQSPDDQTIYNYLDIDSKRQRLQWAREQAKLSWDSTELHRLELNYATQIQQLMYDLPYTDSANNPTLESITRHEMVCLGKSLLTSSYLTELVIDHQAASLPWHTALILRLGQQEYYMDPTNQAIPKPIDLSIEEQSICIYKVCITLP